MGTFSTFKQTDDDIFDTMYKLLRNANNTLPQEPLDPNALKSPQEDEQAFSGIINDREQALKMLNWIVRSSPVEYGKSEAKRLADFLTALNNPGFDRSLINKKVFIPTLYELDRVAASLCLYRSKSGMNLNHNLLVQDFAMLIKALRDYKNDFAQITPEETITRWENAIAVAKAGKSLNTNPELQVAIQQTLQTEQSNKAV